MNRKFNVALAAVFLGSLGLMLLLHFTRSGELVRDLFGVPAVLSLCIFLFQVARDRIAHERLLALNELQNSFAMGATSHMASVAFDKHVEFSEAYVSVMFGIASGLFRDGPSPKALDGRAELLAIRRKWALWITPRVESDLERFEAALLRMGTAAYTVEKFSGGPGHEKLVGEMFSKFAEVMGSQFMGSSEWDGKQITEEVAILTMVRKLRKVLGVEELTTLRARLVERALEGDQ